MRLVGVSVMGFGVSRSKGPHTHFCVNLWFAFTEMPPGAVRTTWRGKGSATISLPFRKSCFFIVTSEIRAHFVHRKKSCPRGMD